jgi:hypothetical protein
MKTMYEQCNMWREYITFVQTNKNWKGLTKLWKDKGLN